MKRLPVHSPAYQYLEQSFKEWLDILGYAPSTVYSMPLQVRGLFHFLEQKGKTQLKDITAAEIRAYYRDDVKRRTNLMYKAGGLSGSHLNKHLQGLYKLCDYLRQSGRLMVAPLNINWEENHRPEMTVLTEEEIKQLYSACDVYPDGLKERKRAWFFPAMALRDKAMLAVYYGCGLRRNEGLHVELSDIFFDKQLVHVRKGKNYKERFVPVSKAGLKHLETYIYDSRPFLLRGNKSELLFISERGSKIHGQSILLRLNILIERTGNTDLQTKTVGLHTLRHSIATHLLANGMALEKIKDFLGHSSLESTQIYTHLVTEPTNDYEHRRQTTTATGSL